MTIEVCLICLRIDRPVKLISIDLVEFHDELCEYDLPTKDTLYCLECEYLLKRFYKFNKQCQKALKIYKTWRSGKNTKRQPVAALHSLLASPTLEQWKPDSRVANVIIKDDLDSVDSTSDVIGANLLLVFAKNKDISKSIVINTPVKNISVKTIKLEKTDLIYKTTDIKDLIQNTGVLDDAVDIDNDEGNDVPMHDDDAVKNDVKTDIKDLIQNTGVLDDAVDIDNDEGNDVPMHDDDAVKNDVKTEVRVNVVADVNLNDEVLEEDFLKSLECIDSDNDDVNLSDDDSNDEKDETEMHVSKLFKKPMNIAKLKEDLSSKFSSCGEIIANDGTPIDKEKIQQCIESKVIFLDLMRLPKALGRRNIPKAMVTKELKELLNNIHERFKDDEQYESVFDIQYLTTHAKRVEEFENRKSYQCYIDAQYKCDICYQPFRQQKLYQNHMDAYHDESSDGEPCPICKMRISKKNNKKNYSHNHAAVYKCKACHLVTYYRHTMVIHFGSHTGKIYRCEQCNVIYRCQSGYFSHLSRDHRNRQKMCTICGRGFSTPRGLSKHYSKAHQKDPAFLTEGDKESARCEVCDVTFWSRGDYDAHMSEVHDVPMPVKMYCRKAKDGNGLPGYALKNYVRRKATRVPFKMPHVKCRLCSASRPGGAWLKAHFNKEHPNEDMNIVYADMKKHLCDVCGSGFTTRYGLRDHMNSHTGERPFACDLCGKRFRVKVLLYNHRNSHLPANTVCTLCGKKFKSKANLYGHMLSHTGEKPHKCEICGKGFRFSATLKEHVNGVHYNIRRVRKRAHTGARKDAEEESK